MNKNDIYNLMRGGEVERALAELRKNLAVLSEADSDGVALVHALAAIGSIKHCVGLLTQPLLELVDRRGWTALHYAAGSNSVQPLIDLTKKYGNLLHWADNRGEIPAHVAARVGYLKGFPLTAVQLGRTNNLNQTPLHLAAYEMCLDQITPNFQPALLLYTDVAGRTVLDIAEESGAINQLPRALVIRARLLKAQVVHGDI
jgi:ankyrin repeat protein